MDNPLDKYADLLAEAKRAFATDHRYAEAIIAAGRKLSVKKQAKEDAFLLDEE